MALTYIAPPANQVYAMDYDGNGHITISFTETSTGTVGLVLKNLGTNTIIPVTLVKTGNNYTTKLSLPKGRYEYYFTDSLGTNITNPTKYNFSVGYVFVIVGHSFAEPNGTEHATDTRVFIYENFQAQIDQDWKNLAKYTGGDYQNPLTIYNAGVALNLPTQDFYNKYRLGPWSRMAQLIAIRDDVTVAIINCAMGGSSVKMWADEAAQRPFEHTFAGGGYNLYNSGLPYFRFENVLKSFGNKTGVTAVLFQHGENDEATNVQFLASYYRTVINFARTASGLLRLPMVLAKSAYLYEEAIIITNKSAAIDQATQITDYTHVGIDSHLIPQSMRVTDGHWNPDGAKEAARLWAEKLTATFLRDINNGISTLPKENTTVTTTETPVPGNSQLPQVDPVPPLNWAAFGGITVAVAVFFLVLKSLKVFKFLRNITIFVITVFALVVGLVFLGINYFTNKNNAV